VTNAEQSRANVEAMKKIELKAKLHASKQSGSDPNSPKQSGSDPNSPVHDEAR
jgi:hypothetical protein